MKIEEAMKILDEVIPPPTNKMVDYEHLPIAIAWATVKKKMLEAEKKKTQSSRA